MFNKIKSKFNSKCPNCLTGPFRQFILLEKKYLRKIKNKKITVNLDAIKFKYIDYMSVISSYDFSVIVNNLQKNAYLFYSLTDPLNTSIKIGKEQFAYSILVQKCKCNKKMWVKPYKPMTLFLSKEFINYEEFGF